MSSGSRIAGRLLAAVTIVALVLALTGKAHAACDVCGDAHCRCSLAYALLHDEQNEAEDSPDTSGERGDDKLGRYENIPPTAGAPVLITYDLGNDQYEDNWTIKLTVGVDGKLKRPIVRCHTRPAASGQDGDYSDGVSYNSSTGTTWDAANGYVVEWDPSQQLSSLKDYMGTELLSDGQVSGELPSQWKDAGKLYTVLYDQDGGALDIRTEQRGSTVVRKVYTRTSSVGGLPVRRRVTVVEYNSDHTVQAPSYRISTTIYGFYGSTGDANAGKLKFVVRPEGVGRYLASGPNWSDGVDPDNPGASCGLDTVSGDTLDDYASEQYLDDGEDEVKAYADDGRVQRMTNSGGGGCSSCPGSGSAGLYKITYRDTLAYGYRRRCIEEPTGIKRVEFLDSDNRVVYEVVYPSGQTTYWITHKIYDGGRLSQVRHPSACRKYTVAKESGSDWAESVTVVACADGLSELYTYDAHGNLTHEKVRKGTSGEGVTVREFTYTSVTYPTTGGYTRHHVNYEYDYPVVGTAVSRKHDYTFQMDGDDPTHLMLTRTVSYQKVPVSHNGPGHEAGDAQAQVTYHYKRSGKLYWNDWTRRQDGSLSYTELGAYGDTAKTIEDVDTSKTSDFLDKPSGWSTPAGLGAHVRTCIEYDPYGRRQAVLRTHLSGSGEVVDRRSWTTYMCLRNQVKDGQQHVTQETTTALVTLTTPHLNKTGSSYDTYNYAPLTINVSDMAGRTIYSLTGMATSSTDGDLKNDWDPDGSNIVAAFTGTLHSLSASEYNADGTLRQTDRYHDIPASGSYPGTLSDNFYRTFHRYDAHGRRIRTIQVVSGTDPTATSGAAACVEQVTQTVYDDLGRPIETWRGVSAAGHAMGAGYGNDPVLKLVSKNFYDEWDGAQNKNYAPGSGTPGVGDGRVTSTLAHYDAADSDNHVKTVYHHNFRGQLRGVQPQAAPHTVIDVDNLGRTVARAQFIAAPTWSTVLTDDDYAETVSTNRRSLSTTHYDEQGRVYQGRTYAVNSSGVASKFLKTDNYYDLRGRLVASASPGRGASEILYDGAGRQVETRTVTALRTEEGDHYDQNGAFYYCGDDAGIVALVRTVYDAASNAVEQVSLELNHNDAGGLDRTNNDNYVRTFVYSWFDAIGRPVATAAYGTNKADEGQSPENAWKYYASVTARPSAPPASSDHVLVTSYAYNAAGRLETVTDPKGKLTKTFHDALGRRIYVAENFDDFDPSDESGTGDETDKSKDRVTKTVYNGLSQVVELVALDANADGNLSDNQTTAYFYEDNYDASLVTRTVYPDSVDSTWDAVTVAYNLDGTPASRTTQKHDAGHAATVIEYAYDPATRRLRHQRVTTVGTGVDGAVLAIGYGYDAMGRRERISSYDSAAVDGGELTGNVVNEVKFHFNDLSLLVAEYQAHAGAVVDSGEGTHSPAVLYGFDDADDSGVFTRGFRPKSVTYPNGRVVYYSYMDASDTSPYETSGIGDKLSRVTAIASAATRGTSARDDNVIAAYGFNGGGRLAVERFRLSASLDVNLDYFGGTSGTYGGLDRFGRVKDQMWADTQGTPAVLDRFRYGHDRNSNRTYRTNELSADKDELYDYDGLDRLINSQRGTVTPGAEPSIGSVKREEDWGLDALGNWASYLARNHDGQQWTDETDHDRTHNAVNEITGYAAQRTGNWAAPVYDARGNMTTIPKPADPTGTLTASYDAWHRLVEVKDGATVIHRAEFDGLNRRTKKGLDSDAPGDPDGLDTYVHYYYNSAWQVLEERWTATVDEAPEEIQPRYQFVWSVRYIDAPVCRDGNTDDDNQCDDERLFYATDANMNVTALIDGTAGSGTVGDVVERYLYDPYGTVTILDGSWGARSESAYGNDVLYCGYKYDAATGIYLVRRRPYVPRFGWSVRDFIPYPDGMNLHAYARGNPIAFLDWSGLRAEAIWDVATQVLANTGDAVTRVPDIHLWDIKWYLKVACDDEGVLSLVESPSWHDTYEPKDSDIEEDIIWQPLDKKSAFATLTGQVSWKEHDQLAIAVGSFSGLYGGCVLLGPIGCIGGWILGGYTGYKAGEETVTATFKLRNKIWCECAVDEEGHRRIVVKHSEEKRDIKPAGKLRWNIWKEEWK